MTNNHDLLEKNEVNANAFGGTELMLRSIYDGDIPRDLLQNFQIIPSRVRDLIGDKIRVMNVHDLPEDPESARFNDPQFRANFHKFVFVSNWQYSRFQYVLGMPYSDKDIVIENGVAPIEADWEAKLNSDTIRLVYASTPQRGLELLVPVFEKLAETHKNIHLDVYSSFKIYGWEDADANFAPLYDRIKAHPQMTYKGFTDNKTLKEELGKAHILAYPSIWMETGCRVLMESMSAGLTCVHPNYGALSETSGGLTFMYHGDADPNRHASIFAANLNFVIEKYSDLESRARLMDVARGVKQYADARFNLGSIKNKWTALLNDLMGEYPPEKREPQKAERRFVYQT
jgi:UDP-glucose:(glucosyl)LPS alpha-1,2-glucosyltransferase